MVFEEEEEEEEDSFILGSSSVVDSNLDVSLGSILDVSLGQILGAEDLAVVPRQAKVCPELNCGKTFAHNSSLSRHKRKVHGGLKPLVGSQCFVCHKVFKEGPFRLREHMSRVHHSRANKECDFEGCSKAFKNASDLKKHKAERH